MSTNIKILLGGLAAIILIALVGWILFFRSPSTPTTSSSATSGFGVGADRSLVVPVSGASSADTIISSDNLSSQEVFEISNGPVTGATFIQTSHPTTTIARYVLQENGHVQDLVIDNSGAVARAVSNTTIPGTVGAIWSEGGNGVILQYLDSGIVKTVHLGFPTTNNASTSAATQAVKIQFLPDNVSDYAVSPDGKSVVYMLHTSSGSDGYVAKIDGTGSKKLFSAPLSELLISWPAPNTLLLDTKSAAGVQGAVFSVSAQSGAITPLVYAAGVSATADSSFAHVIYQTVSGAAASYSHDVKSGNDTLLSFNPIPEKCVWSTVSAITLYCAAPLDTLPANYLDLWHQGAASAPDTIFSYNIITGQNTILAIPGGTDGGVASDIDSMSVSPDGHYLLFVKKGDRSLWGVRLTQ